MKTLALLVIHVLTTLAKRAGPGGRLVQELERVLSSRFTIVEIEHTTKPFTAMNWIID
jgi:hypothetical protein